MALQAWFSNDEVAIEPGSSIVLKLSVHNLGESTESYTIVPSGLTANWVTVERGNLTLFAGSQDVIDIEIGPPMLPSTTAGPTVVGVRVIPTNEPDDTVVAETTLDVQPFDDRRIVALQPVLRARHRANYEFMVENHGNGLASCRLRLIDATDRVDGTFDPPAVGVAPGGASLVRLKSKAKRGVFRRSTRTLDFEVEAEQPGHTPASTALSLVQPPTIPGALLGRVAAVALLVGAAALAWFGVVRPEIRDAADQRVDEQLARFEGLVEEAQDAGSTAVVVPSTVPTQNPFDTDEGEPDLFRLTVEPGQDVTADDSFTVPDGQLFDITDIRIENANNDGGSATLSVNGEELFVWNLGNIRGSFFEPTITPKRLEPGDNVTFSVRCGTIGDPAVGSCANAVNLGGRLIEIDEV
ncbi:COG1470 family protein [Ilumatobacter coccineus]|uniref:Hydrolytic protein n=1 Tax=Ilumatobacter coccineus (strain NBRC 103263 / KCTC 29153 / YM16-304) TaxID=1313172 RepID=A0A6C7EGI5_ILUCY|nr:hypothetical protein [Ilumatobacter coccineus]BAN04095.1 hypothetical protein YM304_37810 [Ilumatobacter coccineus YM16-304]